MYTVAQGRALIAEDQRDNVDYQLLERYQRYWNVGFVDEEETSDATTTSDTTTISQFLSLTYHLAKTFKHGFFVATVLTDLMRRVYGTSEADITTLVQYYLTIGWLIPVNTVSGNSIEVFHESSVYSISLKGRTARTSADHELLRMFVIMYNSLCGSNLITTYTSKGGVLFSQTCELVAVQRWISANTVLYQQDDIVTVVRDLRNEGYVSEILDDPQRLFVTPCGRHVVEQASQQNMTPRSKTASQDYLLSAADDDDGDDEDEEDRSECKTQYSALKTSSTEQGDDSESDQASIDLAQHIQSLQNNAAVPPAALPLRPIPSLGDGAFPGIRVREEPEVETKGGTLRRFSLKSRRKKSDDAPSPKTVRSVKLTRRSLKESQAHQNALAAKKSPRTPRTPRAKRSGTVGSKSPRNARLSLKVPRRISSALVESAQLPRAHLIQITVQPASLYDPADFPLGARQLNFGVLNEVEMARQITLMMQESYSGIRVGDLTKYKRDALGTPLQSLITLANNISLWCVSEILCAPREMSKRAEVQDKFVRLAHALLELRNFGATIPILLGLQMGCVERLQIPMSAAAQEMYDEMKPLSDPSKSFQNYRAALAKVSTSQMPCIVHILVTLQDLIFIEEGNPTMISGDAAAVTDAPPVNIADLPPPIPFVQLEDFGEPIDIALSQSLVRSLPPPPTLPPPADYHINMDKLDLLDNAIKSALQFQSYSYKLAEVPDIQQWYRTGRVILQDKHFFAQSYKIKPPT